MFRAELTELKNLYSIILQILLFLDLHNPYTETSDLICLHSFDVEVNLDIG